jgi:4-hydroxy-3-polyprenylbenzoate decarboxylase
MEQFLELLETENELERISGPFSTELEIARHACKKAAMHGPALLFENIPGHGMPALVNAFASERRISLALGINPVEKLGEITRLLSEKPGAAPGPVTAQTAPCQEIILKGRAVDLRKLPALKCWPGDGGHAINMAVVQTRDMETGERNLGIYRLQIFGKNMTGFHCHKGSGAWRHYMKAEKAGVPLEITASIAPCPELVMSASIPLPHGMDEMLLASMLRDAPLETAPAVTVSHEVPADAGIVLEGVAMPNERRMEGPFGNHTGCYSPQTPFPVFHVRCVTMRRHPVFQATVTGPPPQEDCFMARAAVKAITPFIKRELPEIMDINMPLEGIFMNIIYVKTANSPGISAEELAQRIWALPWLARYKMVMIFDEEADLENPGDLLWRFGNHLEPAKDIFTREGNLSPLDPASGFSGRGGKVCFDCRPGSETRGKIMEIK